LALLDSHPILFYDSIALGLTMKKFIFITISVLGVCLVVILSLRYIWPAPAWRRVSVQYIHMWGQFASIYQITAHAKAREPQLFTLEMSQKTISDSLFFQTDENFNHDPGGGRSPLPYPAVQVYCVAVKIGMDQTEFFFVALHTDGVHSDWVVHTPTGSWKGIRRFLDQIGCAIARY
jgi:hypothetical protein